MTGVAMRGAPPLHLCAVRALDMARRIRDRVHGLGLAERGRTVEAVLKPGLALTMEVDRVGEHIGVACLERLADELGHRIHLIVDVGTGKVIPLGRASGAEVVFAHLDAIDGTIKVGGLGNDLEAGRIRVANDGNWGVAASFTGPTDRSLDSLTFGDFTAAVIVDGNPPRHRAHPDEVIVVPGTDGSSATYDVGGVPAVLASLRRAPRVFTTTNTAFGQTVVYYDSFQAFDYETRQPGDDQLAAELYRRLLDRHAGGPFDVIRSYGNLSALVRTLLGWRGEPPWMESQGAAMVVINENLANLIPAIAILAGAGGISVDFDGRPMRERRVVDGRSSVVHAANAALRDAVLARVREARTQNAAARSADSASRP